MTEKEAMTLGSLVRRLRKSMKGSKQGMRTWPCCHFFVCPPYLCACRFSKMFDPISRFVAGSKCFNVQPVVGEMAQTSEERKDTHTHNNKHTDLLSTPVELCGDHQAGSPEGRQTDTSKGHFKKSALKLFSKRCVCGQCVYYTFVYNDDALQ